VPLPLLENGFEFILFKSSNEVAFESSLQVKKKKNFFSGLSNTIINIIKLGN